MTSTAHRAAVLVLTAGLLAAASGAPAGAQTTLDALAGVWRSEPTAGQATVRTRITARPAVGGAWLEIEIESIHAGGRSDFRQLMLHQATDGVVTGHLFVSGGGDPTRLAGGWDGGDALELTGADGEARWVWKRESECRAALSWRRAAGEGADPGDGESRLIREDCEPPRVADQPSPRQPAPGATSADGRPAGSKPAQAPGSPRPEAAPDEAERAPADPAEVEVEVADLPAAQPVVEPTDAAQKTASRAVILAGRGKPLDEVQKAIVLLRDFLLEKGVAVEGPSDEIVVLQAADASLAYLVREVRDRGAASLLYVTAAFGGRERIIVDCYDGSGLLLWSEKTVGGTGMRQFKWMNPRLVERMEEKLIPRIGGIGLPAGGAQTSSP